MISFEKYEGLGNDFVIIEAETAEAVPIDVARQLCDRRRGIGADGVLLVLPARAGVDGEMVVINADGSIPEMCGNGLRCVALHLANKRGMHRGVLQIDTGDGVKECRVDGAEITVDMGVVRWTGDVSLSVEGEPWELALGDAGNPHAITRRPATRAEIERIGPQIERHPQFAAGTNVEFAVVKSRTEIDLVVWERGCGITHACGTGACATVAVAVEKGWSDAGVEVTVNLPGGPLHILMTKEPNSSHAIMRGPARHVFSGRVDRSGR